MQWLIDHMAAFIIACTIILLLAVMQLRGQQASIETVQYNVARTAAFNLTQVLEQDVTNIGAGQVRVSEANLVIDTTSTVRSFAFWTRPDRNSPDPRRVEYRWEENGSAYIDGEQVPTYEMKRVVNGAEAPLTGNVVTALRITLRNENMEPIYNASPEALARTRRIDLSLKLVSPLGKGDVIEETRWEREVLPVNLRRPGGALVLDSGAI
jgi:hypothetical protein